MWTKEETKFLIENFHMPYRDIAERLGKTLEQVYNRVEVLARNGIKLSSKKRHHKHYVPNAWAKSEKNFIRKNYKRLKYRQIIIILNRARIATGRKKPIRANGFDMISKEVKKFGLRKTRRRKGLAKTRSLPVRLLLLHHPPPPEVPKNLALQSIIPPL